MKTTHEAKRDRRTRRESKRRRRDDDVHIEAVGGRMSRKLLRRIKAAVLDVGVPGMWPEASPRILPVIKRAWHPFPPGLEPMVISVPPGIPTGFGIDLGPAFTHVTPATARDWGVDGATLLATALDNLRALIVREEPRVDRFVRDGIEVVGIGGQGWGSSLILLPDALGPILGTAPRLLLAPVRNHVIALPDDVDLDVAAMYWMALADGAHDELDLPPLRWTGTSVVAIGDPSRGLLN